MLGPRKGWALPRDRRRGFPTRVVEAALGWGEMKGVQTESETAYVQEIHPLWTLYRADQSCGQNWAKEENRGWRQESKEVHV